MAIQFRQINPRKRVPAREIEIRSGGTPIESLYKVVSFTNKADSTASAVLNRPYNVVTLSQVEELFGRRSMAYEIFGAYALVTPNVEMTFVAVADPTGAKSISTINVALTGALTTTTQAGTLNLYYNDRLLPVSLNAGADVNEIAMAIQTAFSSETDLPFLSTVSNALVSFTAVSNGIYFNSDRFNVDLSGENSHDEVILTINNHVTNGSGVFDLTDAYISIANERFDIFLMPFSDLATINELIVELERRQNAQVSLDGIAIIPIKENVSIIQSFVGTNWDTQTISIFDIGITESSIEKFLGSIGNVLRGSLQNNANDSLNDVLLPNISFLGSFNARSDTEAESLLGIGVSTIYPSSSSVFIQRAVTQYKTDERGNVDTTFYDLNSIFATLFMRREWVERLGRIQGARIVRDGISLDPSVTVLSPSILRNIVNNLAVEWQNAGLIASAGEIVNNLRIEIVGNRFEIQTSGRLVNVLNSVFGVFEVSGGN